MRGRLMRILQALAKMCEGQLIADVVAVIVVLMCWEILTGNAFFEEFETRFAEMLTHYPTKRSALVPTLLYAQDEVVR